MATENFEAVIAANIRDFQRAMRQVDQQIRDAALGADAPIDANISDFMAQMSRVDAQLAQLAGEHTVDLDADISTFQREMNNVNRLLNDVSTGATADIGAHTADFLASIRLVDQHLNTVEAGADADIGANILAFNAAMRDVERRMRDAEAGADPTITADISAFLAEMALVDARLAELAGDHDVDIDVDVDDDGSIERLWARLRRLASERIVIPVRTSWRNYQNTMGQIASFSRNMSEIMAMTARGIMISISPAIVPIIASLVGLLGQLGPMLGAIGGSTFGLVTAFAAAGIGAAGFGAIAVTNLKDIFGASSELKDLQEKLDDATTLKERTKIMKEMKAVQGSMNKEQTAALSSMDKLKDTWTGIASGLETKTIQIFTQSLDIFGSVLRSLTPMFTSVTDAVGRLTASMSQTIKSDSMKAFFDYMNTTAGPMLETISKSVGNFIKGFLNMMVAFEPLADSTAAGFLKMSEGFATWAAGLGESKKFQAFVDYVNENMPKIRAIFRDAFVGIINTFAAFAPSSADMMTSLQNMMARFKEWSSTLSENQGFQNFINYVKENGPRVVDLIGNITTFIVALGVAFAPMGATMLDLINRFLEWSTAMMENHPLIGKIMAAVVVFGGAMLAALPHVLGIISALGVLTTPIGAAQVSMLSMAATFITRTAAMVASTVAGVATIIGRWLAMGVAALIHAAKVAAAWVLATGVKMVTAVASMATTAATFVAKWVVISVGATIHAAKVAAAWALSTGAAMVKAVASMIATSAIFVAKWLWMGVQSLLHAAKMAAAWFIALGPVGWVIGAIVALAVLVIANWNKIKSATSKIWTSISNAVKKAWETVKTETVKAVTTLGTNIAKMPGKVKEFTGKMLSAGKDLIRGLIDGIKNMGAAAIGAITGVVDGVVNKAKSLLGIKSPSRVFAAIGEFTGQGLVNGVNSTVGATKAVSEKLANAVMLDKEKVSQHTKSLVDNVKRILVTESMDTAKQVVEINKKTKDETAQLEKRAAEDIRLIYSKAKAGKRKITEAEAIRIRRIEEDSAKKIKNINTKAAAEIKKITTGAETERIKNLQTYISDKKKLEQISLKDEVAIWQESVKHLKNNTDEKKAAMLSLRDAQRAVDKQMLDDGLAYIDEKKRQGELSLADELKLLKELEKNYTNEAGNSKFEAIQQRKAGVIKQVNSEIQSMNNEHLAQTKKFNDDLIAEEKRLQDEYEKTLDNRAKTIASYTNLFDGFEIRDPVASSMLMSNLNEQITGLQNWQIAISDLSHKAIDEGLLDELRQMGPKALPELRALNSMTNDQLTAYSNLYQQKSAIARKQAEAELVGMKKDTENRIIEMRKAANKELDVMEKEWISKVKGIMTETDIVLKSLKDVGTNAAKGLYSGLADMEGPLVNKAKSIAESIKKAMSDAFDIHSPSRWMRDHIAGNMGLGFIKGADDMKQDMISAANRMSEWMKPNLSDLRLAPIDTQSQMTSLRRQIKQELSIDMTVNHSGASQNDPSGTSASQGDIVINVDGYELMRVLQPHADRASGNNFSAAYYMRGG